MLEMYYYNVPKTQHAKVFKTIENQLFGQSKGLKAMKVYDKKAALEDKFRIWVSEDSLRQEKYGEALSLIESAYTTNKNIALNRTYLNEAIFMGSFK
jgi:hypothetical protein